MTFQVKVRNKADAYVHQQSEKSQRIIFSALKSLRDDPYPGRGWDKERLVLRGGREVIRLHIAHTFTAFYSIDEDTGTVRVYEILSIEQAHKRYGRL